jgi:hypothetical protein
MATAVTGSAGSHTAYLSAVQGATFGVGTEVGVNPPNLTGQSSAVRNVVNVQQTTYLTIAFTTTTATVTIGFSAFEF